MSTNLSPSEAKFARRLRIGLAAGAGLLLFGSCGYWVGRPWTCADAKAMLESRKNEMKPLLHADSQNIGDRLEGYNASVQEAESDVDKRCNDVD